MWEGKRRPGKGRGKKVREGESKRHGRLEGEGRGRDGRKGKEGQGRGGERLYSISTVSGY